MIFITHIVYKHRPFVASRSLQADPHALVVTDFIWTLNRQKNLPRHISLQDWGPVYNNPPTDFAESPSRLHENPTAEKSQSCKRTDSQHRIKSS